MFFETLESRQLLTIVPVEGTPFSDYPGNYLPPQSFHAGSTFLSGPATGEPLAIALSYLQQNAATYGLTSSDLTHFSVTSQYTSPDLGVTHIYLEQTFNGLPVADANININVMNDGRILTAGANFVPGLAQLQQAIDPQMAPGQAVFRLAAALGIMPGSIQTVSPPTGLNQHTVISAPNISRDPIDVELQYVPSPGGGVDLAWEVIARPPTMTNWFDVAIAASGFREGSVIRVADWTANAEYNVFPAPVQDPVFGNRAIVVDPWDAAASPFGWHDGNGTLAPDFTDTRGNNVFAQEDASGAVLFGLPGGFRPQGGSGLNFNFPIDFNQNPQAYQAAAITNLFYWVNIDHDVAFNHGFTEAAGNFQFHNYTTGGLANDPVLADNQELYNAGFLNNAFMATPPDGQRPNMGMFLFDTSLTTFQRLSPLRDGSLDGSIISHEFTHGTSNRLTGGPANANALQALQSGGMGEGWSDWFALVVTAKASQTKNTPRGVGQWVSAEDSTGGGIRRFPYSFDMSIDPLQLNDFNGDTFPQQNNSEVHNAGEIWCTVLWDLTRLLIDKYGFSTNLYNHTGGQNVALDLVLGGMKLQPTNPSFIDARDAIIAADQALTGGQNFTELWTAFARRGFGFSASAGLDSNSVEVSATFDLPPLPVSGTVFEDLDGDGVHDANEGPLTGWTVYNDANNNNSLDAGEARAVTGATGIYSIPVPAGETARIREVVKPGWRRTAPSSGVFTVNVALGQNLTNFNFLNQQLPSEIHGTKFNDLDGNGTRDPGEPGIQGVVIYVDLNQDGKIGVLEPAATTDANGNYAIKGVLAGTNYQVREAAQPGLVQTFPDPADPTTLGGAHVGVSVVQSVPTTGIDFGNKTAFDFGDAPASYGTLLANNGPRHGILTGFGLTLTPALAIGIVDAETNGQPHPNALGDDLVPAAGPDDENGVQFLAGLTPGALGTVRVGVRTGANSPGFLQAWVDFNRDGDFLDPGEQVIKDRQTATGVFDIQFAVPATAQIGQTFARFRYGFERGIGPLGPALAGEVEDHVTNILLDQAIATNDVFPDRTRVPPDPFIKLNTDFADNSLDVLRNDFGTSTDPQPQLIAGDFSGPGNTLTTAVGGTIQFNGATAPLSYKPKPGYAGPDSFTYRITAGGTTSAPATVSITVSPADPIAIDDIVRLNPNSTNNDIFVLANDLAALNQPIFIVGAPAPLSSPIPAGTVLQVVPSGQGTKLVFTPAPGFKGTLRYTYTIDDLNDPSTNPSSAVVTIQVTDNDTTPAPSHLAIFKTQYLSADALGNPGSPTTVVDLTTSPFFFVQLIVQDPAGGTPNTFGVESAYVDMIVQEIQKNDPLLPQLVEPVLRANGTEFDIQFVPNYTTFKQDDVTFSLPGVLNEIGATHDPSLEPSPPNGAGNAPVVVMNVKFRALGNGQVKVQADHSDSASTPVVLFVPPPPSPPGAVQISDDQVFIQPAGVLTIVGGSGEGEFTNFRNVFDVNDDSSVNPLDILVLVNDMTQNGARSLNQMAIALSGLLPSGYLDVNIDSNVNTLDILSVVNYLTSHGAIVTPGAGGSGEGEGEGEAAPALADGGSGTNGTGTSGAAAAMVNFFANQQPTSGDSSNSGSQTAVEDVAAGDTTSGDDGPQVAPLLAAGDEHDDSTEDGQSETGQVDADAADELFASLSSLGDTVRHLRHLAR